MRKLLFILFMVGCKGGEHQEILLFNKSNNSIYYILHTDTTLTVSDIELLRPETDNTIKEHFKNLANYSKKDSLEIVESLKTKGIITPDSTRIILASSFVGIFRDKETIQQQIKDEYNGYLKISIINESDLKKYSNKEIIDRKLYKHFATLTEKDISKDITILEYK